MGRLVDCFFWRPLTRPTWQCYFPFVIRINDHGDHVPMRLRSFPGSPIHLSVRESSKEVVQQSIAPKTLACHILGLVIGHGDTWLTNETCLWTGFWNPRKISKIHDDAWTKYLLHCGFGSSMCCKSSKLGVGFFYGNVRQCAIDQPLQRMLI